MWPAGGEFDRRTMTVASSRVPAAGAPGCLPRQRHGSTQDGFVWWTLACTGSQARSGMDPSQQFKSVWLHANRWPVGPGEIPLFSYRGRDDAQ